MHLLLHCWLWSYISFNKIKFLLWNKSKNTGSILLEFCMFLKNKNTHFWFVYFLCFFYYCFILFSKFQFFLLRKKDIISVCLNFRFETKNENHSYLLFYYFVIIISLKHWIFSTSSNKTTKAISSIGWKDNKKPWTHFNTDCPLLTAYHCCNKFD